MHLRGWRSLVWGGLLTTAMVTSCGRHRVPSSQLGQRYAGPLQSSDVERGGHIFRTFCNPCHAGRVTPDGYLWSPAQMRRQIREGNRAMPAIRPEYLPTEDMEAVLAFLTVIGAVDAPLPDPDDAVPPARSNPREASIASEDPVDSTGGAGSVEAAAPDDTASHPDHAATIPEGTETPAELDEETEAPSPAGGLDDPSEDGESRPTGPGSRQGQEPAPPAG